MSSPLQVDTSDLRLGAAKLDDACAKLETARASHEGALQRRGQVGPWAAFPAMDECVVATTEHLTGLMKDVRATAEEIRQAASGYDAADSRSADRNGRVMPR